MSRSDSGQGRAGILPAPGANGIRLEQSCHDAKPNGVRCEPSLGRLEARSTLRHLPRAVSNLVGTLVCVLFATNVSAQSPLSVAQALRSFRLEAGLVIEPVAAEPITKSPCAIAWDERGRCFVAENPGYPVGPGPVRPPVGAIVMLADADGDGRMDTRTEFATGLAFPNGLTPWRGGWIVTDSPDILWLADTNADGRADVREVWFTGLATNQTTQLRASHPTLSPDGWIYVSRGLNGGVITSPKWPRLPPVDLKNGDFRFRPDGSGAEAIGGNGQFGLVIDDVGRRFICANRNPLMLAMVHARFWRRNPALPFSEITQDVAAPGGDALVWPVSADTTTAGFITDLLGKPHAGTFTSACGIELFHGTALPPAMQGSWFICEPAQNLVQRQVARNEGAGFRSRPATEGTDFLASTDTWFRPVFAASGPDGALYIVDMYRRVIDHPEYLPAGIRGTLDFDSGKDMGRIWRIRSVGNTPAMKPLATAIGERVVQLGSADTWTRRTATRLLLQGNRTETLDALLKPNSQEKGEARRIRLLGALLDEETLQARLRTEALVHIGRALADRSSVVREAAMRALNASATRRTLSASDLSKLAADDSAAVRFEAALFAGGLEDKRTAMRVLAGVAVRDADDRWARAAALSGITGTESVFLEELLPLCSTNGVRVAELMREAGQLLGSSTATEPSLWKLVSTALASADSGWSAAALTGAANGLRSRGAGSLSALAAKQKDDLASSLQAFFGRTALVATNRAAPLPDRLRAAQLLGEGDASNATRALEAILTPAEPRDLQLASAKAMGRFNRRETGRFLVEPARWAAYTPAILEAVLSSLLSQTALTAELLAAIEAGTIPGWAVDAARRRQLQNHRDPAIRSAAARVFAGAGGANRMAAFNTAKSVLTLPSDAGRGRPVFQRVCAACHRLGDDGVRVGPDLAGLRNQPAEALLLHIVVPDAEMYPGYQACDVETRDGRTLAGLLVAETDTAITLRFAGGDEATVQRANVRSMTMGTHSLMPQELEKTMTRQELADLIAHLRK